VFFRRNVPVFFRERESIRLFCKNPFQPAASSLQADLTMKNLSRRMEHAGSIRLFLFFSQKQTNTEAAFAQHIVPARGYHTRRVPPWGEPPQVEAATSRRSLSTDIPTRVRRPGGLPAHGPGRRFRRNVPVPFRRNVPVPFREREGYSVLRNECFTGGEV
jgi:hypothetical protein